MSEKNRIVKSCKALSSVSALLLSIVIIVLLLGSAVFYFWFWPGNLKTEEMYFENFNAVEIGWAFEVSINQGSSYSVTITADEKIIDQIEINQTENRLSIGFKAGTLIGNLFRKVEITMPDLNELILSGATATTVEGFCSIEPFNLELSGASSLGVTELDVENFEITVSGVSSLSVIGEGINLVAVVSGASDIDLSDFSVVDADMLVSGASRATINLDGRLDAEVSGASTLEYIGEPTLGDINSSGASTIRKK